MSEAIVLHVEPKGEYDSRVSLFTHKYGKLNAKVKSSRKITSKLAGHLQPGNIVNARLVYVGGHQVVDALKSTHLDLPPQSLYILHRLLADQDVEHELWSHLITGAMDWRLILRILGWDPDHAACRYCRRTPAIFRLRDQEYYCERCSVKARFDEVILV